MFDGLIWNSIQQYPPFPTILTFLSIAGLIIFIVQKNFIKEKNYQNLFFIYAFSILPLLLFVPLNVNRGNIVFIPIVVFSAYAIVWIFEKLNNLFLKLIYFSAVFAFFLYISIPFHLYYYTKYKDYSSFAFNRDFDAAFYEIQLSTRLNQKIYISENIPINYIFVLYKLKVHPREFQKKSEKIVKKGTIIVKHYDNYYFTLDALQESAQSGEKITFLLKGNQKVSNLCIKNTYKELKKIGDIWTISTCKWNEL